MKKKNIKLQLKINAEKIFSLCHFSSSRLPGEQFCMPKVNENKRIKYGDDRSTSSQEAVRNIWNM